MDAYSSIIANAAKISGNNRVNQVGRGNLVKQSAGDIKTVGFDEVLSGLLGETASLQFSKHAQIRLNSREIALSDEQLKRVEGGVNEAGQKGINNSLVLVDNVALLVNIASRTVVTAMNQDSQNVFTNIDGAVIV